ncbi:hypothetical protein GZH49_00525 [Nocardia terpenica]|uniref:hypothetical protein n=1 Tax=Nocardia terpenica TaxID=455432 RepID=UPI002FDF704B
MTMSGWQLGLAVAIGIPLGVLLAMVTPWPRRILKHRSAQAIRERVEHEAE